MINEVEDMGVTIIGKKPGCYFDRMAHVMLIPAFNSRPSGSPSSLGNQGCLLKDRLEKCVGCPYNWYSAISPTSGGGLGDCIAG
jgi:hypothetical protein